MGTRIAEEREKRQVTCQSLEPHRGKVLNTGNLIRLVNKYRGRGQVPEADRSSFSVVPVLSKRNEIAQRSPAMSGQSN